MSDEIDKEAGGASWDKPPPGGGGPSFWERTFDEPRSAKWGCYGTLIAIVVGFTMLLSYCSNRRAEQAATEAIEARAAAQERDAEYERSVADGSVCADGWGGSNIALVDRVKDRLRDPDSFEHERTTISRRSPTGGYLAVMQYRAKNGFGGFTDGVATAALKLAGRRDCQVSEFRLVD